MFTTDNTNGLYGADLLDEMNEALESMLDVAGGDEWSRQQNEKNFSDWIAEVSEEGMTADEIVKAAQR